MWPEINRKLLASIFLPLQWAVYEWVALVFDVDVYIFYNCSLVAVL